MRTVEVLIGVTLAALLGCGSGTTTTSTSGSGAPASVTLQAGDGQTAAPGAPVAIRPSVIVRDSGGHAVAGTAVTFAVDSGGGTVTGATVTTGSDGVAAVGGWTLGPVEGRNRLRATVSGLSAVVFFATGQFAGATVLDISQPASGGSLTVSRPGDPLDGLRLTVPFQAYPSAVHWQISYASATALPQRPSLHPISPLIHVQNGMGTYADSAMILRIPVHVASGRFAMAFYYDRSTGTIEALPLAGSDSSSVTVMTRHFSAASLLVPQGAFGGTGARAGLLSQPEVGGVEIFASDIDLATLDAEIDSHYRPAIDGWDVSNLSGWAISAGGHCAGWSTTSLWYYYEKRHSDGSLYNRYGTDPSIWPDNVRGWRWADLAWGDINWQHYTSVMKQIDSLLNDGTLLHIEHAERATYYSLAYATEVTGMPQLLLMAHADYSGHAVVAYRETASAVYYADPSAFGLEKSYHIHDGLEIDLAHFDRTFVVGISAFLPWSELNARWNQFIANQLGVAEYPAMTRQVALVDGVDTVWATVQDTIRTYQPKFRLRALCPSCPPYAGVGDWSRAGALVPSGVTTVHAASVGGAVYHNEEEITPTAGTGTFGVFLEAERTAANEGGVGGVDYRVMTVLRRTFAVAPGVASGDVNAPLPFVAHPGDIAPSTVRYVWNFNDGTGPIFRVGDSAVTHAFPQSGQFTVNVKLYDIGSGGLLAQDSATANIGQAAWQLLTFRLDSVHNAPPVNNATVLGRYTQDQAVLTQILQGPTHAVLIYTGSPNNDPTLEGPQGVFLQYTAAGATTLTPSSHPLLLAAPVDSSHGATRNSFNLNVSGPSQFIFATYLGWQTTNVTINPGPPPTTAPYTTVGYSRGITSAGTATTLSGTINFSYTDYTVAWNGVIIVPTIYSATSRQDFYSFTAQRVP